MTAPKKKRHPRPAVDLARMIRENLLFLCSSSKVTTLRYMWNYAALTIGFEGYDRIPSPTVRRFVRETTARMLMNDEIVLARGVYRRGSIGEGSLESSASASETVAGART